LLPAGAISPGGICTHWKNAALARRTPKIAVRNDENGDPKAAIFGC